MTKLKQATDITYIQNYNQIKTEIITVINIKITIAITTKITHEKLEHSMCYTYINYIQ